MKKLLLGLLGLVATFAQAQVPGYRIPPVSSGGSGNTTFENLPGKPSIYPSDFSILLNKPAKYPSSINLVDGIDTALANRVLKVAGSRLINATEIGKLATVDQPVSITEKGIWNNKQNALGYTPFNQANVTTTLGTTDTKVPTEKATKDYTDAQVQAVMDTARQTRYAGLGYGLDSLKGEIILHKPTVVGIVQETALSADKVLYGILDAQRLGIGTSDSLAVLHRNGKWKIPAVGGGTSIDVQIFTSSGTWTKPTNAKYTEVIAVGGGGGGASGRKGAAGSVRCGGGGGGSAGLSQMGFQAAILPATLTVSVGNGGSGGAAQTANSTNGNTGSAGSPSSFGTFLRANPGSPGSGGTGSLGTGGNAGVGLISSGTAGGAASTTGGAGSAGQSAIASSSSGGAGGGITSSDAASAGGNSGGAPTLMFSSMAVVAGGAIATSGNSGTAYGYLGSAGGGGGSSVTSTAAGAGGTGSYGAGGGGGGAGLNDVNNSGSGGNGGPGLVIVITYF